MNALQANNISKFTKISIGKGTMYLRFAANRHTHTKNNISVAMSELKSILPQANEQQQKKNYESTLFVGFVWIVLCVFCIAFRAYCMFHVPLHEKAAHIKEHNINTPNTNTNWKGYWRKWIRQKKNTTTKKRGCAHIQSAIFMLLMFLLRVAQFRCCSQFKFVLRISKFRIESRQMLDRYDSSTNLE